jgi:Tol biopolymer transport system component
MKRLLMSLTVGMALFMARGVAQTGSELFSQALSKEKTEGKLDESIALYQRIVNEFANDHALAAKALIQMGHAYEKLGKREARSAYDRVLREYADQRELAAEAGARIAVLDRAQASGPANAGPSGLVARQVWTGPDVDTLGSTAADGRFLSFTDWRTGDLAIRDTASGEKRQLTHKGTWDESPEEAEISVVSPDASQIAYSWLSKDLIYELRLISRDGGQPRVLYRNDQMQWLRPCAWSPDGRTLAVELSRRDRTTQLALVSLSNGAVRVLRSFDWRGPTAMEFSPDGRYLAYDFPPVETAPERDVFVIAADGSGEATIVRHPANDVVLGWFPNEQRLLFASDRSGTNSLWSIRVENGRPQGEPALLKEDIGRVVRSGFTRAGDFYYGLLTGVVDVFIANLDPGTGKVDKPPAHFEDRYEGGKWGGTWSADGARLAYVVQPVTNLHAPPAISILTSTAGPRQVQTLRVPMSYVNHNHLAWLKDGSALLIAGTDLKGRQGLFRFNLSTSGIEALSLGVIARHPSLSPDGGTLFYERRSPSRTESQPFAVVARNLTSGDERVVYPHGVSEAALSPDGESLAFVTGSRLEDPTAGLKPTVRVMPARGGAYKEIWTFDSRAAAPRILVWAGDGKSLLFTSTSETTDEAWRLPLDGRAPVKIGVALPNITALSLHPDGRQLAISSGISALEIWVMQNLASASPRR